MLRELKHSRAPVLFWIEKQEGKEITWAVPAGPCGTAGGTRRDVQEDRLRGTQGWLTRGLSASWKLWKPNKKSKCRAEVPSAERGGLSMAGSAHCGQWGREAVSGPWLPSDPFPGVSPAHSSSHCALSVIPQQQGLLKHQTYLLLFISHAIFQKQQTPNFASRGFYSIYPLAQATWRFIWVISKNELGAAGYVTAFGVITWIRNCSFLISSTCSEVFQASHVNGFRPLGLCCIRTATVFAGRIFCLSVCAGVGALLQGGFSSIT